jgi:hypothetical protein
MWNDYDRDRRFRRIWNNPLNQRISGHVCGWRWWGRSM